MTNESDIAHYQTHGYVIKRGFFAQSHISALREQVDTVYQQWLSANKADVIQYQLVNMAGLTAADYFDSDLARAQFFSALAPSALIDLTEGLFGSGIHFHNSQLFFNPIDRHKPPYWHRDMQYDTTSQSIQAAELESMLSLHVRIPLLPESGLEVVPGTHRRWDTDLEQNVRLERNGHHHDEALPGSTLIFLKPGDLVIFHAQMIHRGQYLNDPGRMALDLCIGKAHHLTTPHLNPGHLPNPKQLKQIDDPRWYEQSLQLLASRQ